MDKQLKMKRLAVLVSLAMPLLAQAQAQADANADADGAVLPTVQVSSQKLGSDSYTAAKAKGSTPLDLSLRDTPQSVSVVTQQLQVLTLQAGTVRFRPF